MQVGRRAALCSGVCGAAPRSCRSVSVQFSSVQRAWRQTAHWHGNNKDNNNNDDNNYIAVLFITRVIIVIAILTTMF